MGSNLGKQLDDITAPGGLLIDQIVQRLGDAEREALGRALNDPKRASSYKIAQALTEAGHPIGATAVKNWRQVHGIGSK